MFVPAPSTSLIHPLVSKYAKLPVSVLFEDFGENFFSRENAAQSINLKKHSGHSVLFLLKTSLLNPFSVFFAVIGCISFAMHILLGNDMYHKNTALIIFAMLFLSGLIRFVRQLRIQKTVAKLKGMSSFVCQTEKNGKLQNISSDFLRTGDIIYLKAGDMVPADCRIIENRNLFVSESALSGESMLSEKKSSPAAVQNENNLSEYTNCLFKGSCIAAGSTKAFVLAVGDDTVYGKLPLYPAGKQGFDKGAKSIAHVFYVFMAVLIPLVFLLSGFFQGTWLTAFLFALSAAVGLIPEMLPMVITACLIKGSTVLAKKKAVVKNIQAIQTLGQMDVLCVDKTGTLTNNELLLEYYLDILGNENKKVLDYAYLNAVYHSGIENPLDKALCRAVSQNFPHRSQELHKKFQKIEESPFYGAAAGVLARDVLNDELLLFVKGDAKEIFACCSFYEYNNVVYPLENQDYSNVRHIVREMQDEGMKVIAVAYKKISSSAESQLKHNGAIKPENLILLGYAGFFDAPKKQAAQTIAELTKLNTSVKVLTGDNLQTALSVCRRLAVSAEFALTGKEFEKLPLPEKSVQLEKACLFAELSPKQKALIVELLQKNGHTVGYLGDGLNDIPAILQADAGISSENAHVSLQQAADIILTEKDLSAVHDAILEGRKIFLNMSKYIRITASSNFGNILSIVLAGIFLPFLPMTSLQILMLNIAYDCLCLILPWDNADAEQLSRPRKWNGSTLGRFMLHFGTISTVFDCLTFVFLFFIFCPLAVGNGYFSADSSDRQYFILIFQSGWFLASLWTQTLILHLLRTPKIPFIQSKPSKSFLWITAAGLAFMTFWAYSPFAPFLSLNALPLGYVFFLAASVALYLFAVSKAKAYYYKKYSELI